MTSNNNETALLELATKVEGEGRDVLALSDKEAMILELYDQIQEQELEIALLEQGIHSIFGGYSICEGYRY